MNGCFHSRCFAHGPPELQDFKPNPVGNQPVTSQKLGARPGRQRATESLNGSVPTPRATLLSRPCAPRCHWPRFNNTQTGSTAVAQDKAMSAAMFRRPTKAFQDALAGGGAGLRILTLRGANAVEGGVPIVIDGKIVGGIGVSGGSSEQDGVVAKAGTDGLAAK